MEYKINNKMAAVEDACTSIYNRLDFDSDGEYQENLSVSEENMNKGKMMEVVTINLKIKSDLERNVLCPGSD